MTKIDLKTRTTFEFEFPLDGTGEIVLISLDDSDPDGPDEISAHILDFDEAQAVLAELAPMVGDDRSASYSDEEGWPEVSFIQLVRVRPDTFEITIGSDQLHQLMAQDGVILVLYYDGETFPSSYYFEPGEALEFLHTITHPGTETTPDIPNVEESDQDQGPYLGPHQLSSLIETPD